MTETATPIHGYSKNKDALIKRLHRIEGQVRGVEKRSSRTATASTS